MLRRQVGFPFLAVAIAFIAIGISSNKTFMYVGVVFLIIGFGLLLRGGRR